LTDDLCHGAPVSFGRETDKCIPARSPVINDRRDLRLDRQRAWSTCAAWQRRCSSIRGFDQTPKRTDQAQCRSISGRLRLSPHSGRVRRPEPVANCDRSATANCQSNWRTSSGDWSCDWRDTIVRLPTSWLRSGVCSQPLPPVIGRLGLRPISRN